MTNSQSKMDRMETTEQPEELVTETVDAGVLNIPEPGLGRECVICYEELSSTKNMCITECGHEFCFSCMMKHVQRNNGCPCCRTVIIEDIEDSDSEYDSEDEETLSDEDEDEDSDEENEND